MIRLDKIKHLEKLWRRMKRRKKQKHRDSRGHKEFCC